MSAYLVQIQSLLYQIGVSLKALHKSHRPAPGVHSQIRAREDYFPQRSGSLVSVELE
jgi:hypothetical protein